MSTFTHTSKFLSLTPYVLMEYRYGSEPHPEYHPTTYGSTTVGFERIVNGYFNGAVQISNRDSDKETTGNVRDLSAVQISQNTFVRLDIDRLKQYLDYDNKLTDVANLPVQFDVNLNVYYDTIRYHFLGGFDFGLADGVILQVQFPEKSGKKSTISQITYQKDDIDIIKYNPNPIYFNAGIYDKYVEVKIPSYNVITYEYESQVQAGTANQTVASKLSSDGYGFVRNNPFTISLYEIESTQRLNGFYYYNTQIVSTATMTPFDEYGDLAANIVENTTYDYFDYYPSWKGNFVEDFIYVEESLGNSYYIIHDIELSEQIGLSSITSQRFQTIQTKDYNSPYIYRPIVTNPRATSFTISYSMRLVNKSSNISILRVSTLTSTEVDKYGPGLNRINLLHQPYPQKIYNKVVEPIVSKAYTLNVNPLERVITKYVPAFFERDSINITEENLTLDNLGGLKQADTKDATIAFGQGKAKIVINPYDNYYKFRIFTKNDGKENTLLDLGNSTEFYLNFEGGNNLTVKVPSLSGSTFQNPNKGELVFKLVEADSKKITSFSGRDFHIVAKTSNGIETSLYHGYWILPSERDQKPVAVTVATPTPNPVKVEIAPVSTSPTTPTVNVIPQQPSTYFDPKVDPVIINVPPVATNTTTIDEIPVKPVKPRIDIDVNTLAREIKMSEDLKKTVKEICDYYLVPGSPGNSMYTGITKMFFLDAAIIVHPNTTKGFKSAKFLEYEQYLGIKYLTYQNTPYTPPKSTTSGCFAAGTEITLIDNSVIAIEKIKEGQVILTYNEQTGNREPGVVKALFTPIKNNLVLLSLSNGVRIKCTTEHPIWAINKGWSSIDPLNSKKLHDIDSLQLMAGDILTNKEGKEVVLESVEILSESLQDVYNLGIEGNHTYYANGILVHNKTASATNNVATGTETSNYSSNNGMYY